jgi:hypothetical protein
LGEDWALLVLLPMPICRFRRTRTSSISRSTNCLRDSSIIGETGLSCSAELGLDGHNEAEEASDEKDVSGPDSSSSVSVISSSRTVDYVAHSSTGDVEV